MSARLTNLEHTARAVLAAPAIDRAEFRMQYQPIIDCRNGELAGERREGQGLTNESLAVIIAVIHYRALGILASAITRHSPRTRASR